MKEQCDITPSLHLHRRMLHCSVTKNFVGLLGFQEKGPALHSLGVEKGTSGTKDFRNETFNFEACKRK